MRPTSDPSANLSHRIITSITRCRVEKAQKRATCRSPCIPIVFRDDKNSRKLSEEDRGWHQAGRGRQCRFP
jgi:hypothetical protein